MQGAQYQKVPGAQQPSGTGQKIVRMQEGLSSLMQMTKTSAVLHLLSDKQLPFISVLTDQTMGGVSASFAFAVQVSPIMVKPPVPNSGNAV